MGPYGEIIAEHSQFEHAKHRIEIWKDIFNHTDKTIYQNQEKLLKLYNKNPRFSLNEHQAKVRDIINKDIAYPKNYKAPVSFFESYMATKKLKNDLK